MKDRLVCLQNKNLRMWIYPEQGFQIYRLEQDIENRDTVILVDYPPNCCEPSDRRFGNPILFPNPGVANSQNGDDTWIWNKKTFSMPPHGFGRNFYWKVTEIQTSSITGELVSSSSTKAQYPFDFRVRVKYSLEDDGLVIETWIENTGENAFPYAFGFHPYFRTPLGPKGTKSDCTIDLPKGIRIKSSDQWRSFSGEPFSPKCLHALDPELSSSIALTETNSKFLHLMDKANKVAVKISVEESPQDFPVWVVWSASVEAPYVCIEPWTDLANALNRSETRRCMPQAKNHYRVRFSAEAQR
jgi:galactose mutarotase-like enzyme